MKLSEAGLNLIKRFETLSLTPYVCPGNHNSIGWGHKILTGEKYVKITEDAADSLLRLDVEEAERTVHRLIKTASLTQNQYDALVSFTFNLGYGNLRKSTLRRKVNAGEHILVPKWLLPYIKADGEPQLGLLRRRLAEGVMYVG